MSQRIIIILVLSLSIISTSYAALFARGADMVYDDDLDITWLSNANAGAGSSFDNGFDTTDGRMTWANANAWVTSLTVGGVTGWRLPEPDLISFCSTFSCDKHEYYIYFTRD